MHLPFADRYDSGRALAEMLRLYADRPGVVVLGLPRGGVVVAYEVARALRAPLDVFVVRKLGVPGFEELAMGAIATGGVRVLNKDIVQQAGITATDIERVAQAEQLELQRREDLFRAGRPRQDVAGKTVLLVDDGLATGATMRAAAEALRQQGPHEVIVAVPVAAREVADLMREVADSVVVAAYPEPFMGVGRWYENFEQTTDQEVRDLLDRAQRETASTASGNRREVPHDDHPR